MSEHTIKSTIGEDLSVEVSFDYEPAEAMTYDHPGCNADVVNIVAHHIADGMFRKDITDDLSAKCMDRLKMECFESVENSDG
jgi:hypothetical protein